ncbi:MAG: O-antigen ligase family protein [Candidatus Firestonebacteria bacterium]
MFRYLGNNRFQMWFNTPNEAALFIIICICILTGIYFIINNKMLKSKNILKYSCAGLFYTSTTTLLYMEGLTYSRGGYISFVMAYLFMVFNLKENKQKITASILFIIFVFLIIFISGGAKRTISIVDFQDKSIENRITLWKSTLAMSSDNPIRGVGFDRFFSVYQDLYQPMTMRENYSTAINGYITISSCLGFPVLCVMLALVIYVMLIAQRVFKNNSTIIIFQTIIICFLIGNIFSNLIMGINMYLFLASLGAIIMTVIALKKTIKIKDMWNSLLISITFVLILYGLGKYYLSFSPIYSKIMNLKNNGCDNTFYIVKPVNKIPRAILFYLFRKELLVDKKIHQEERALTEFGYIVISPKSKGGIPGIKLTEEVFDWIINQKEMATIPIIIIAQGDDVPYSMIICSHHRDTRIKGIVSIGATPKSPFKELSIGEYVKKVNCPVVILSGENYYSDWSSNAFKIRDMFSDKSKVLVQIIEGESEFLGDKRMDCILKNIKYLMDYGTK